MKARCHRCEARADTEVKECCAWGNCYEHCEKNHSPFFAHCRQNWDAGPVYGPSSIREPTPGNVEEEETTEFPVKDWPMNGGSLDLEGELW